MCARLLQAFRSHQRRSLLRLVIQSVLAKHLETISVLRAYSANMRIRLFGSFLLLSMIFACGLGRASDLALVGAKIYPSPTEQAIENGSILVHNGQIAAVGTRAAALESCSRAEDSMERAAARARQVRRSGRGTLTLAWESFNVRRNANTRNSRRIYSPRDALACSFHR